MKREDLKKLVDGITDEQITAVLDLHTADIGKAKGDADKLKSDLEKATNTIGELEKAKGDTTALTAEIDKYKKQIADAEAAEAAKRADSDITARLEKALGEKKFSSEYTRAGVLAEFKKALADEVHKGKGDNDILSALTKDKDGVFAAQNTKGNMGGAGGTEANTVTADKARSIMGLPPLNATK